MTKNGNLKKKRILIDKFTIISKDFKIIKLMYYLNNSIFKNKHNIYLIYIISDKIYIRFINL